MRAHTMRSASVCPTSTSGSLFSDSPASTPESSEVILSNLSPTTSTNSNEPSDSPKPTKDVPCVRITTPRKPLLPRMTANKCIAMLCKMGFLLSGGRRTSGNFSDHENIELGCTNSSGSMYPSNIAPYYQQSATRKLAFGGMSSSNFSTIQDEKAAKHLGDFYNNSTLSNFAKLFSACVILSAIFILVRGLLDSNWPYEDSQT
uniref:Uncharacterized protein n=1 Tax=Panagrellus redivivus TaxID=6233 RepID=A0A7E4UL25_PANRE